MSTNAPETLMTRSLLDVFNQRDPQQRAAAIEEIYSPDIVFHEQDGTVTGAAAMQERVQRLLDGAPGFVFTPVGQPAINHDLGRLPWTFGPPDGSPVVFGTDIARMAGDRIQALYVFVEPPSSRNSKRSKKATGGGAYRLRPTDGSSIMTTIEPSDDRSAAITGAGSGLGRELALQLDGKGYGVFGTALSDDEIEDLRGASDGRIRLAIVDITDEKAVHIWAEAVNAEVQLHGLDLLINNAGILTPGPLEVLPLNAIRREFEVNVFGGITVTNALLPSLRQARGRIIFVGAMTGRFPLPFNGPSSITKAALEAVADVYRAELSPWGLGVTVAQAGNMVTGGPAKTAAALQRTAEAMTEQQQALYGEAFSTFTNALNSMQSSGLGAADAAARIVELAEQQPAPTRAPVGEDAESILQQVREKSDTELDALRLELVGLRAS